MSAVNCPADNNVRYVTSGRPFRILCGMTYGTDKEAQLIESIPLDFEGCIRLCATYPQIACQGLDWFRDGTNCTLFSAIGGIKESSTIDTAILVPGGL